jgi:two-component system response regulator MprA
VRVLVVDDDPGVRDSLRRSLAFNGYEVDLAEDGQRALTAIALRRPEAVILDVMMPGNECLETCRRLRAAGEDIPVLMLTARESVADRVSGLDAGADDYLVKPFALDELLARLRALLRRTLGGPEANQQLKFSDLVLDLGTREVWRDKRSITLTRTEFHLLELLMRHPRQVLERGQILEEVWGYDFPTTANSLEVYVGYLRRKLEAEGEPRLIHTVRGVGYSLRELPS